MTTPTHDMHRARLYRALALGFDRPDDELRAALEGGGVGSAVAESASALDDAGLEAAAADLVDAAIEFDPLRAAYVDLFGVAGEDQVAQYEVAYAPGSLMTNTDRLADLAGFYRAFGLDVADDERDRADYLPTQLEFMHHLAVRRAYLAEEGDDEGVEIVTGAQRSFLEDHLGRWIPRFVDDLSAADRPQFYGALGTLLSAFLAYERRALDATPDEFEENPPAPLENMPGLDRDEEGRLSIECGAAAGAGPKPARMPMDPEPED